MAVDSNAWPTVLALVGTGVVSLLIGRISKGFDARGAAEAALIGTGPAIITEMNRQNGLLQAEITRLWTQAREYSDREQKCRQELAECQFNLRSMEQRVIALEHKLRNFEPKFPPLEPGIG